MIRWSIDAIAANEPAIAAASFGGPIVIEPGSSIGLQGSKGNQGSIRTDRRSRHGGFEGFARFYGQQRSDRSRRRGRIQGTKRQSRWAWI